MKGLKSLIVGSSGNKKLRNARPIGFSSPGLSGSYNKSTRSFDITRSSGLSDSLASVQERLGQRASAFENLRGSSAFSDLIRGRVDAIRAAGSRTIGNLRQQLGQRRVLGSSFASREIASQQAMFARDEATVRAQGRLDQLGVESQLIDQQFQASVQQATTMLDQLNLESGLAAQLGDSASKQMLTRAQLRAELDAADEANQLDFLGTLVGMWRGVA